MDAPLCLEKIYREDGTRYRLRAYAGLRMIRGNRAPYFSLTADQRRAEGGYWREDCGGACHDLILTHFPECADIAALHLSDINGAPMHALENGFYYLAGMGIHYKLGTIWRGDADSWKGPDFAAAARHFRISEDAARQLVADHFGDWFSPAAGFLTKGQSELAKARLAVWVEAQRPRWKAEADACIAAHGLQVYGDAYTAAA